MSAYMNRLRSLRAGGLTTQSTFILLRTYINGAIVHLQRGNHTPDAWCLEFDTAVVDFMTEHFGTTLNNEQRH